LSAPVLQAVRQIDERLRIYPQFGQPLRDLVLEPLQLWIGVVPPLVVQYILDEERRVVMVVVPILPLPRSGLQDSRPLFGPLMQPDTPSRDMIGCKTPALAGFRSEIRF
jgi:hypothetical protein